MITPLKKKQNGALVSPGVSPRESLDDIRPLKSLDPDGRPQEADKEEDLDIPIP
jgi:hypothetical protein